MLDPLFAILIVNGTIIYVGKVSKIELDMWAAGTKRAVLVENPLRFTFEPISNSSVNIGMGSVLPLDTAQKEMYVTPSAVEVIGAIENDSCSGNQSLFSGYQSAVDQRRAQMSGLAVPNMSQVSAMRNPRGNVTPFNPRQR